jgi:choline-glycine betaine transporter
MQKDFNVYKPNATYDLWSKYEALHKLVKEDKSNQSRMMVLGLTLLFIMLELITSLIKLLSQDSEYDMVNDYVDECTRKKLEKALAEVDSNSDPDDYIIIPEIQVA